MPQTPRLTSLLLLGCMLVTGHRADAMVEQLGPDRLLLTGSITRSDTNQVAEILATEDHGIKTLVVCARGVGSTAWEAAHELSRLLQDQQIEVDLLYAENAAIGIHGWKTTYRKGKQIAWKPVDIRRNQETRVGLREFVYDNGSTTVKTRTITEALAPTVDAFDAVCRARIPAEAENLGGSAALVVGRKASLTNRKGLADATNQYWYYTSTNGKGVWRHDANPDLIKTVENERDWAERKLKSLRKRANRPARPARPAPPTE